MCSADSPNQTPLEIDGEILRFAALQLGADADTIHAYARRRQTVSEHQQRIGEYLRLRAFDAAAGERLARFLEDEALRLERTASLLARARAWLRDEHALAPSDPVLRRAIGAARHKARTLLTQRMAERLSAPMREGLDALVAVDDDQPHSPLNRIKASSSSPSVGGMKRLLARLELIEATGVLGVDVGWVNGNYQRILFHSVRTASADRVRRMAAPRPSPRAGVLPAPGGNVVSVTALRAVIDTTLPTGVTPQTRDSWARARERGNVVSVTVLSVHHSTNGVGTLFRATGITAYLSNGGTLEHAQRIAGHASPKTTKFYDRTVDAVSLDEIERIVIVDAGPAAVERQTRADYAVLRTQ